MERRLAEIKPFSLEQWEVGGPVTCAKDAQTDAPNEFSLSDDTHKPDLSLPALRGGGKMQEHPSQWV